MPLELQLPASESARLLWGQVVLLWMVANYGYPRGPYGREEIQRLSDARRRELNRAVVLRSFAAAVVCVVLTGLHVESVIGRTVLAICMGVTLVVIPFGRMS